MFSFELEIGQNLLMLFNNLKTIIFLIFICKLLPTFQRLLAMVLAICGKEKHVGLILPGIESRKQ